MKRKFYLKPAKRNSALLILLSFSIFCFACSKEKIPEEVLAKVYVENIIVNDTYSSNADSLRVHKQSVFNKYKITEKEFEAELEKYSDDKTKWADFFKRANDYLNNLKKSNAIN